MTEAACTNITGTNNASSLALEI